MSYDGLSIAALARELRQAFVGTRIQKIVQPDPLTFAIEAYGDHRRSWLVLSADPRRPRAYLASVKPGRGVETPSPLLLLLRKHADGLRFAEITQPPGERILSFELAGYPREDDRLPGADWSTPTVEFRLIIEAISQYSNLILVDAAGIVVDAARRVTAEQNRSRVTLPRHPYTPPPAQAKRSLWDIDEAACRSALQSAAPGGFVWQALVASFAGLGPLAGREIAFRALGDARARVPGEAANLSSSASHLAREAIALVEPVLSGTSQPSIARAPRDPASPPDATTAIAAFAPYPLTHLGNWEATDSLSSAAEAFFEQGHNVTAIQIARATARRSIDAERSLVDRKRESLQRALERSSDVESLRQKGELLLTYSSAIPRGAATFGVDGTIVELDPRLTAVENAQACFRRYRKAKAAIREVPALLDEVNLRLRYLDEVAALVELAETGDAVREVRNEIRLRAEKPNRPARRQRARRPEAGVLRLRATDASEILVGRSALQNQAVTFDLGRPDDVWLHARGCPGAHVILRTEGETVSSRAIREAAGIAAYYSANRPAGKVTVDWTRRKHVRRLAKGVPGLVSYTGEQSIIVRPEALPGSDEESDD